MNNQNKLPTPAQLKDFGKKNMDVFHAAAGTHKTPSNIQPSNIDMNNSGGTTDRSIPQFGIKRKNGALQFNTPIQPAYKNDPLYPNPEPDARDGDRTFKKRMKFNNSLT